MSMLQAEWIGQTARIVKASNKCLENTKGKIINETQNLIEIQTPSKTIKVPKKGTLLAFETNGSEEIIDCTKAAVSPEERIKLKNGRKNM